MSLLRVKTSCPSHRSPVLWECCSSSVPWIMSTLPNYVVMSATFVCQVTVYTSESSFQILASHWMNNQEAVVPAAPVYRQHARTSEMYVFDKSLTYTEARAKCQTSSIWSRR
jgi:hypothetical protein